MIPLSQARMQLAMQFLRHPCIRLIAAAITLITTRHLITDGFHYPMLLLLSHNTIAFVFAIASQPGRQQTEMIERRTPTGDRIYQAINAILVASSLVFGYQSFLHLSSTTFWIMAMSLNWDVLLGRESTWSPSNWMSRLHNSTRCVTLVICGALLVVQEHRLTAIGDKVLVIAIICLVTSGRLKATVGDALSGKTLGLDNRSIPLAAGIPATVIAFFVVEVWDASDIHLNGRVSLLLVNAIAGAVMLGQDGSTEYVDRESLSCIDRSGVRWLASSIFLALVAGLDNATILPRPTITTAAQWIAFLLASAATINIDELVLALSSRDQSDARAIHIENEDVTEDFKSPLMRRERSQTFNHSPEPESATDSTEAWARSTSLFFQSLLHGLVWLLVAHYILTQQTTKLPSAIRANPNTNITWDFDIVVARYEEPLHEVAETMNSILTIPNLHNLKTRIILYNKGSQGLNDTNIKDTFGLADEVLIRPLPNVGREAETYLSHILSHNKDDLAEHTLFIQAEPHDAAQMKTRLRQYFVKQTGFLSLSNVGRFCGDCDRCGDLSGWRINSTIMRDIYERANAGEACKDISLTYRGQFIVSRQRLQDVSRALLEEARERLLESKPFGYTMERLWGVMFRCPSILSTCPSLLSGSLGNMAPGGVKDCQCLD